MRRTLAALALAVAAAAACLGQQPNVAESRREMNLGAREYSAGRYAEAEQHFRRALELDPEGKNLRLYIARAVQQQYKPDDTSPENIAAGERAVAAYRDILAKDPTNDDAFKAIAFLYGQMKQDDKMQEHLLARANDFSAPNEKRAEVFTILASRQWRCAYDVTERQENKTTENVQDKPVVRYKMPADAGDLIRARQCVTEGLSLAEQAAALDPKSANALSYKANLLREAAKLSEMEGDAAQKAAYERQYEEASESHKRLSAEAAQKAHAEGAIVPAPAAQGGKARVSGGVLNGKAISKPMPAYPPDAKAKGVQGTVTVRVLIDEQGRVAEAEAVSGQALLREAAVAAARGARFPPTLLSGQPVKVSGVLTYNFVLK